MLCPECYKPCREPGDGHICQPTTGGQSRASRLVAHRLAEVKERALRAFMCRVNDGWTLQSAVQETAREVFACGQDFERERLAAAKEVEL